MSDAIYPLVFDWDGESFIPRNGRLADRYYVVGESYRLAPYEERSANSHNHYFAAVNEVWMNLPEDMAERFPTAEHLRKFALIKAGYCDERSIVCASKAEAQRVAAFLRPMDEYAVVTVREAVVTVFTPKSQSYRAMGKKDFGASKQAVLEVISGMVGVKPEELRRNVGRAA